MLHGKFYYLADDKYDPCIPYEDIMPLLKKEGYDNYILAEYEGHHFSIKEDETEQLTRYLNMIKRF